MMKKYCKDCEYFECEIPEETICEKADMVIRLRRGQGRPDWCPIKKQKDGEHDG